MEPNNTYTWQDVKDATNHLFKRFFNNNVNDYVGGVCDDALPSALTYVLAYVGAYNPGGDDVDHDIELLRKAYKQITTEGKIGY